MAHHQNKEKECKKKKKAQLPMRDWMQFFPLSLRNSLSRQCGDNQCWIAFWQEPFQNGFQPVLNLESSQQLLYIFQMGHQVEILKNDIAISSNSSLIRSITTIKEFTNLFCPDSWQEKRKWGKKLDLIYSSTVEAELKTHSNVLQENVVFR